MKDVQCYEIYGGIALKNRAFSFFSFPITEELIDVVNKFRSQKSSDCNEFSM